MSEAPVKRYDFPKESSKVNMSILRYAEPLCIDMDMPDEKWIYSTFGGEYHMPDVIPEEYTGYRPLVCLDDSEPHEGHIYMLLEKGGYLYEIDSSHCSCNGHEGGWKPSPVTIAYLKSPQYRYFFNKDREPQDYNSMNGPISEFINNYIEPA